MVEKLGEPSKRYRQVGTELDKISSLPGHIIDNILSHLTIRDAVRTSILSRNWKYKWTTIPSFVFDEQSFPKNELISSIDRVFILHKGPIQKLKLSHDDFERVSDIVRWIVCISRSFIKEIILQIRPKECYYKLPSCLFNCQNLTRLELYNCTLKPPPTFKGFKNLKTLDLKLVTTDQDVLENLICSCFLLERLTLVKIGGFKDLNIDAPNLQFLAVDGYFYDVSLNNTFNLTSVSIGFNYGYFHDGYFNKNIKRIHDESKADENSSNLLRFFTSLPHIQRLDIRANFLEYLALGNIPRRLPNKCLDMNYLKIKINFIAMDETEAILSLLRSSPNLQELEIWTFSSGEPDDEEAHTNVWGDDHWSSLFTHLRVATLMNISGFSPELDFINFILSNAPALERLAFKPASKEVSSRLEKKLFSFKRASSNLEIICLEQ